MSKQTVTRLFVGSLIAIVAGIVLAVVGIAFAFTSGAVVVSGPGVPDVSVRQFTVGGVLAIVVGGLGIAGGAIGQFIAWIGAVINTSRLEDKTWFILLLVLGLLSFGFIAMLVYVLAGPDGMPSRAGRPAQAGTPA